MSALDTLKEFSTRKDLSQKHHDAIEEAIRHIEMPNSEVSMSDTDDMYTTSADIKRLTWPEDTRKDMHFVAEGLEELAGTFVSFLSAKSQIGR